MDASDDKKTTRRPEQAVGPAESSSGDLDDLFLQREIRQARLAARKAGSIDTPIEPLPDSELDAPITIPDEPLAPPSDVPQIEGYLVGAQIGAGGQGSVYRAVQESTTRKVAIKVLAGGMVASARSRTRFEREAEILASLDHPYIVGIVDRGRTADGSFFIAMQYVDGMALDEYLATNRREPRLVLPLFAKVADAIGEAHIKGIVHRDVKASNILIDQRGEPHVTDFGLARLVEEGDDDLDSRPSTAITQTGQILGSLPWLSPEQARGAASRLDARADVYSLGVVLYHALTGQFPCAVDGTARQTLANIEGVTPLPPSSHVRGLSRALDVVVLKALAKLPEGRYRDARELGEDVSRLIAGERPIAMPRTPFWKSWPTVLIAALAVAAVGVRTAKRRDVSREVSSIIQVGVTRGASAADLGGAGRQVAAFGPAVTAAPGGPSIPTTRPVDFVNSVGMRMVRLPSGRFIMGSPETEAGRGRDEKEHEVQISRDLLMSVFEVTQKQYVEVLGHAEWDPQLRGDDLPADNISWLRAVEFCSALSRREGRTYRLPTEAEWEYAARAGTKGAYSGDARLDDIGWHLGNAGGHLHPVGTRAPNAWGLFDMEGNVFEWCSDYYDQDYPDGPVRDPTGAVFTFQRVRRGGSVRDSWQHCRVASRTPQDPETAGPAVGFRVVLDQTTDHARAD